ncbi:host shutoff protein [Bacillus phage vB_BsuM-Goe2]|uniref:Host shutoff protein n=1 Tax=Bacillus phage vB_BsuM-Goe2 TaxID=1933062 RepID=A0A217EQE9_9CAUD|nr:host shutoff protein [Bacillus phage vB_BsuM-Goe2]APZ82446.1 host shutoff protein [Bacillus phage vB_BsuM-Goe2]
MHIYTYWGLKYVPSNSTMVAKEGDLILLDNEVHKVVKVLHRFRNITDLQITNWKGTETRYNLHVTEYKVLVPYDTHKEENEAMSDSLITHNGKDYVLCKIPARVGDLIRTEDKRVWEVLQKSKDGLVLYNEEKGEQRSAVYSEIGPYHVLVPRDTDTHTPTREELAAVIMNLQKLIDKAFTRTETQDSQEDTGTHKGLGLTGTDLHRSLSELDAKVQSGYYTATENEEDVKSEIEATKKHMKAVKESGKTVNDYRKEENTKRCKLKALTNKFNRLFLKSVIDTDSLQVGKAYLIGGRDMKNVHGLYTGTTFDQQHANFLIVETDRMHRTLTVSAEQLFAEERHIVDIKASTTN